MNPAPLISELFPTADAPFLKLGVPIKSLRRALKPWLEEAVPDRTGAAAGRFDPDGVDASTLISVSVGKLASTNVTFDLNDHEDVVPSFGALADHFDKLFGPGKRKDKKLTGSWQFDNDGLASELHLDVHYMEILWRAEIAVRPAEGVDVTADESMPSWIDMHALAKLVATKAWPEAKCLETYRKFFAFDSPWTACQTDRETASDLVSIYEAVGAEQGKNLRPLLEKFFAVCDWSHVHADGDDDRSQWLAYGMWRLARYAFGFCGPEPGVLVQVNIRDIANLVQQVSQQPSDRAAWGWKIVAALQFEDEAAFAEVGKAIIAGRAAGKDPSTYPSYITFDSGTAAIDERAFALDTSGLSDEARLRSAWMRGQGRRRLEAATDWLAHATKTPMPPPSDDNESATWARHLIMVHAAKPALFLDAIESCVDALKIQSADVAAAIGAVSRHGEHTGKALWNAWRFDSIVITTTGKKGGRGRVTIKRHADAKAAAKDFAKKSTAAR